MRTKLTRPSFVQLLPILFFLLAAIPAGAIGVWLTHSAWERELQTVQEQHLQIARNLVAALTRAMLKTWKPCFRWSWRTWPHSNQYGTCLLYTSPSPRDRQKSRMPSSA